MAYRWIKADSQSPSATPIPWHSASLIIAIIPSSNPEHRSLRCQINRTAVACQNVSNLRTVLSPLYSSLQREAIFALCSRFSLAIKTLICIGMPTKTFVSVSEACGSPQCFPMAPVPPSALPQIQRRTPIALFLGSP